MTDCASTWTATCGASAIRMFSLPETRSQTRRNSRPLPAMKAGSPAGIFSATAEPDYSSMPADVYTAPAVATVGMTEAEAKAAGRAFAVKTNDMTDWRSAKTHAESVAYAKVLVEDGSNLVLGAHMVGHGAEEVIHIFSLAMKHGLTSEDLATSVYAYPTFTSDLKFLV